MNLEPLHDKLNREHPRFSAHLTFAERDEIVRTIIHSIGDVAPDVDTAPRATEGVSEMRGVFGLTTEQWADNVIRAVSELDGYTSPEDAPDVMQCTADELRDILTDQIPDLLTIRPVDHPSPSLASATAGEETNFNSGEHRPWDGARLDASEAVVREARREYKNCALQDEHPFGPDEKETLRRICNVALAKWREEWYDARAASPPVGEDKTSGTGGPSE